MELQGLKIAVLGDSITDGTGASSIKTCYCGMLESKYGCKVYNHGKGGTRIAEQIGIIPTDPVYDHPFVTRVDELEEDSDLIIIFGGTNDFGHGDAPLGDMSSRSNKTFYGALHNLYRAVINRFYDKKIIVLTPTHRRNEENICAEANQRPFPTAPLKGYVDIIKEVAQYYSLPVLDLFSVSGMQPDVDIIREKYMPDGLHPSDLGHERLADLIAAFIKTL